MNDVRLSKFLSLVLRHEPERLGLTLDAAGWVSVDELLAACARERMSVTRERLEQIVASSDKQRFSIDKARSRIRANQGHSVPVELGYAFAVPPELLFHGTIDKFLSSIRAGGLRKGERHHMHLSENEETARKVGARRGRPVILVIRAGDMQRAGHTFFLSSNGVWLVDHVPAEFLGCSNAAPSGPE